MKHRRITPEDMKVLREMHDKFYGDVFHLPDLTGNMLASFVIEDDNNKIILGGGVRPLAETIIVTDKEYPNMTTVGRALVEALNISKYACRETHIDLLHAFVKNSDYSNHLLQRGFFERDGKALALRINNGWK